MYVSTVLIIAKQQKKPGVEQQKIGNYATVELFTPSKKKVLCFILSQPIQSLKGKSQIFSHMCFLDCVLIHKIMCIYMTPEQKWNYLRAKMKLKKDRKRKKKNKRFVAYWESYSTYNIQLYKNVLMEHSTMCNEYMQ